MAALLAVAGLMQTPAEAGEAEPIGLRVPKGFEVSRFADDSLAHDIYSMTIDAKGRVVVSGRGYIRILVDSDGDGTADKAIPFADGPKTGAQGMYFHGPDLLCTGDAGLIRYRDRNGDDRADGPPDLFLKLRSGGEHDSHSIQRGPDGWWYLVSGNYAGIDETYVTRPTSPIRKPLAGTLMRLAPDMSGGEIVADGFRNSYDFAFTGQGDVLLYDSDGERDISLPWYRPTRVFQALPGSHAGFISRSWKRPAEFADMPPVVAKLGRGSPTGVVAYRHTQFPKKYHGALFVLDWTFGRVMALPLTAHNGRLTSTPISFMTGVGQFGFAPTDAAVGPDGSLYVCVGGRGTRGVVYRVRYQGTAGKSADVRVVPAHNPLLTCLRAPQPLSSWSRAKWVPQAQSLGRDLFRQAAGDETRPAADRIRAIEILTELFGGLDTADLVKLAKSKSPEVRARAAWSHGRTHTARPNSILLQPFVEDAHPLVARFALEALSGAGGETDFKPLIAGLALQMNSDSRVVRQAAARLVGRLAPPAYRKLAEKLRDAPPQAQFALAYGRIVRSGSTDRYSLEIAMKALEGKKSITKKSIAVKLEAARLMQIGLGDLGPRDKRAAVYDGYASRIDLAPYERLLDPYRTRLAALYPTGHRLLDRELARILSMLRPYNTELLDKLLAKTTDRSNPVADIHQLIVASRIPVGRTDSQRSKIATALVNLDKKIHDRKLRQDSNWDDRIGEMYAELVRLDSGLPVAILHHPDIGRPGHVLFLNQLDEKYLQDAVDVFAKRIRADDDYPWSNDVVYVLGESKRPKDWDLLRAQFDNFALRSAVLIVLAYKPDARDRSRFLTGLESSQLEVLTACIDALSKLPKSAAATEQFALVEALRRLGQSKPEFLLRERIVKLLRRNTGKEFGFVLGAKGYRSQQQAVTRWTDWLAQAYPKESKQRFGRAAADLERLKTAMTNVTWTAGDPGRGFTLFKKRGCAQCHGGRRSLGPDLAGVAGRFSRKDLFAAIVFPNRDVSPRYQTTMIQTDSGKVYSGLIVYEAVDGLLLRDATGRTFRIEAADIESRRVLKASLMPVGLLKELQPNDLADLYAYLQSLGRRPTKTAVNR